MFSCKKEPLNISEPKITYTTDISPMMMSHGCCMCHCEGNAEGGIKLDSFDVVKKTVMQDYFFPQLTPSVGKIYANMPPYNSMYVMMDENEINTIKLWIKQGFNK